MTLLQSVAMPATPSCHHRADDDRLALLRCLLADRAWTPDAARRARLAQVLAALRAPGGLPLDEAQWTLLADETARYLEYRRQVNLERQFGSLPERAADTFPRLH